MFSKTSGLKLNATKNACLLFIKGTFFISFLRLTSIEISVNRMIP